MKRLIINMMLLGIMMHLTSCAKSPPSCDSGNVTDKVEEIILSNLRSAIAQEVGLEYINPSSPYHDDITKIEDIISGLISANLSYEVLLAHKDNNIVKKMITEIDSKMSNVQRVSFSNIRIISKNDELKKVTCAAQVTIKTNGSANNYTGEYSAQNTEDGKIYVEVAF